MSHCFFSNASATTEIYTLSLHDALPISARRHEALTNGERRPAGHGGGLVGHRRRSRLRRGPGQGHGPLRRCLLARFAVRSEEHTSELQSHSDLVCRLLLEKKKNTPCTR